MQSIITISRDIPDPRSGNARRQVRLDILTIALVVSIRGCESGVDFADFAEDRDGLFRDFSSLENGLPGHDTFSGVFRLLDPTAVAASFERFAGGSARAATIFLL